MSGGRVWCRECNAYHSYGCAVDARFASSIREGGSNANLQIAHLELVGMYGRLADASKAKDARIATLEALLREARTDIWATAVGERPSEAPDGGYDDILARIDAALAGGAGEDAPEGVQQRLWVAVTGVLAPLDADISAGIGAFEGLETVESMENAKKALLHAVLEIGFRVK
jgi:hypothetical protein